jgi:tripartite ATP-independent transporter DctP family solute receptor
MVYYGQTFLGGFLMKKRLVLAIALLATAGMLFAGGGGDKSAAAAPAAAAKPVVLQIGYENHPGERIDLAIHKWAELLAQKSGGAMKIEIFPSSQLGNKNAIMDQMIAGMNVCTLADGAFYADRGVKDLGIVFAPYLFGTWDEVWKLVDSDWWKGQMTQLDQKGIHVVTAKWQYGERETVSKKAIRKVEDFQGQKLRVPNNVIQVKGMEVLGCTPTPMPLGDVYTAMQQGVIDGMENPLATIDGSKVWEVAKYITMDGHVKNFCCWAVGKKFWDSLTPQQQTWLQESGDEAGAWNNAQAAAEEADLIKKLEGNGVEIIKVDLGPFQKKAEGFYDYPEIKSMFSPGLYQTVKKAMGAS